MGATNTLRLLLVAAAATCHATLSCIGDNGMAFYTWRLCTDVGQAHAHNGCDDARLGYSFGLLL